MFRRQTSTEESQLRNEINEAMKEIVNRINQDLHESLLLPYSGMGADECNKHTFSRIITLCKLMEDEASRVRRSIEAKLGKINPDLLRKVMLLKKESHP